MGTILIVALLTAGLGFIPLVGLPGGLWLVVAAPVVNLLLGPYQYEAAMARLGPSTWGLALGVTLVWPVALPVAFLLTRLFVPFSGWTWKFLLPMGGIVAVLAVLVATAFAVGTVKSTAPTDTERLRAAIAADDVRYVLAQPVPDGALYTAIAESAENVALALLEKSKELPRFEKRGGYAYSETPLHFAVAQELPRLVDALLKRGADLRAADSTGATPAHGALGSRKASATFVEFLASRGADFRAVDHEGQTPLMHLAKRNAPMDWAVDVAKAMVKAGADPKVKDKSGKTAADYARETYNGELATYLDRS